MVVVLGVVSPVPLTAVCRGLRRSPGNGASVPASEPALAGRRFELCAVPVCGTAVTAGAAEVDLHDAGAFRAGRPRLYRLAAPVLRTFDAQRLGLLRRAGPHRRRGCWTSAPGRDDSWPPRRPPGYRPRGSSRRGAGVQRAAALGAQLVTMAGIEEAARAPRSLRRHHALARARASPGTRARRWSGCAAGCGPAAALLVGVPNLASLQARIAGRALVPPRRPPPPHSLHRGGPCPAARGERLRGAGGPSPAARAQPLRDVAVGREPRDRHPSYLYNLLKRNAPLDARDLALTLLAVPLACRSRRSPSWPPAWPRAAGRSPSWPAAATDPAGVPRRTGSPRCPTSPQSRAQLPLLAWKEAVSAICSVTRRICSAGSVSLPSRCRARSGWLGLTTRSSSPSI